MATSIPSPFPDDQQQQQSQEVVPNPEAVSSSAWHSSGSIGPFFAVISVLTLLAIISCVLGRTCKGRKLTPLESIRHRGCFGWFRRKCCLCTANADVLGDKAVDGQMEKNDGKAQEGV